MSDSANQKQRLQRILDRHAGLSEEAARAKRDAEQREVHFLDRWQSHRDAVVEPALRELGEVLDSAGWRMDFDDRCGDSAKDVQAGRPLGATLYASTPFSGTSQPRLTFWAMPSIGKVATHVSTPRRTHPGPALTLEELTSERAQQMLVDIVEGTLDRRA